MFSHGKSRRAREDEHCILTGQKRVKPFSQALLILAFIYL
jgi:hypothetical protein